MDEDVFKIIFLGDQSIGKTSLIHFYIHSTFTQGYKVILNQQLLLATVGADLAEKHIRVSNRKIILQIWDTAGQERFRSLSTLYFRGSDCVVLCYSDESSFRNLKPFCRLLCDICQPLPFIVLVLTKSDLEQSNGFYPNMNDLVSWLHQSSNNSPTSFVLNSMYQSQSPQSSPLLRKQRSKVSNRIVSLTSYYTTASESFPSEKSSFSDYSESTPSTIYPLPNPSDPSTPFDPEPHFHIEQFKTSALKGQGINELFEFITKTLVSSLTTEINSFELQDPTEPIILNHPQSKPSCQCL